MAPDDPAANEPRIPEEDVYAAEPQPAPQPASPVDDLKKGLGLLFRAAKGAVASVQPDRIEGAVRGVSKEFERAVDSIPTSALETAIKLGVKSVESAARRIPVDELSASVKSGAKEVGRAFGSVAEAVERTVTGAGTPSTKSSDQAHRDRDEQDDPPAG
jgi:hypothetical protein